MSPELRKFLTEWLEWATTDAIQDKPFDRRWGLCTNLLDWIDRQKDYLAVYQTEKELRELLGNEPYPFGDLNYFNHEENQNQHEDNNRIAWIKEQLNV